MASLAKIYGHGLHRDYRYYYTHWLPNGPMEVGVVGELVDKYLFRPLSTLKDRGVDFVPERDVLYDEDPSPMKFSSSSGFTFTTKLGGQVNPNMPNVPEGKAGIKLEFGKEGAFTMEAQESYEHRIRDVPAIEQQVLKLYRAGKWSPRHVVVFALVEAPYADIIISESASSAIELEAEAEGDIGKVELGSAELQFGVRHTSGRVLDMRGSRNVGPVCQLLGLKRRFFGKPSGVGPLKRGMGGLDAMAMEDMLALEGSEEIQVEDYQLVVLGGS